MRASRMAVLASGVAIVGFAACGGQSAVSTPMQGGSSVLGVDSRRGNGGPRGDGGASTPGDSGEPGHAANGASGRDEWLRVVGSKIVFADGTPFHGRGANLHDTRSCGACTYLPEDAGLAAEVMRRADVLVDEWHATFIRLDLESYASDEGYRKTYRGVLDDPAYLASIVAIVRHLAAKPGVYVLVSDWMDPTVSAVEWPTEGTRKVWARLAEVFAYEPRVLFGLVNEPHDDPSRNAALWQAMNDTVQVIRDVEKKAGGRQHIVLVQGTHEYARHVDYYLEHPITAGGATNVAYEVHVYNPTRDFEAMFVAPSKKIPIVIGEFGPFANPKMTLADVAQMMNAAEHAGVPYIAWNFHERCPPNLIEQVDGSSGCDIGMSIVPTSGFGELVKERLARPW